MATVEKEAQQAAEQVVLGDYSKKEKQPLQKRRLLYLARDQHWLGFLPLKQSGTAGRNFAGPQP